MKISSFASNISMKTCLYASICVIALGLAVSAQERPIDFAASIASRTSNAYLAISLTFFRSQTSLQTLQISVETQNSC